MTLITDFVRRVTNPEPNDYPVRNLTDCDFYKFPMNQFIAENYPGTIVRFELINRELGIPLARIVPEEQIRWAFDHMMGLKFRRTDLYYLNGMDVYGQNMFKYPHIEGLKNMEMCGYTLERVGDQYRFFVECEWERVSWWETMAMAAIMELYYRNLMAQMPEHELAVLYGRAADKLYKKLKRLAQFKGIRIADFGQRRRHSFLWQRYAIEMAMDVLGEQFTGTSNTYLAGAFDLVPIGTNAHELPMVITALLMALADKMGLSLEERRDLVRSGQYKMLPQWSKLYGKGLRIVLPDTYGSRQFYNNMPADLAHEIAHEWRGERPDSGDPVDESRFHIEWLKRQGVENPLRAGKVSILSDGLDVRVEGYDYASKDRDMIEIYQALEHEIATPFGWGTNFTNDFKGCLCQPDALVPSLKDLGLRWRDVFRGFSLVCKVTAVNGHPAVKLSNNPNKATGEPAEVKRYIKVFEADGLVSKDVNV